MTSATVERVAGNPSRRAVLNRFLRYQTGTQPRVEEPSGSRLRLMGVQVPRRLMLASTVLALVALTGCSGVATSNEQPTVRATATATTTPVRDEATALCQSVAESAAAVVGVTPTTVGSIRQFRSGPLASKPHYPLARSWPGAGAADTAAWCQVKSGNLYVFLAVTHDRPPIQMATTDRPLPGGGYPPVLV